MLFEKALGYSPTTLGRLSYRQKAPSRIMKMGCHAYPGWAVGKQQVSPYHLGQGRALAVESIVTDLLILYVQVFLND